MFASKLNGGIRGRLLAGFATICAMEEFHGWPLSDGYFCASVTR